MIRGSIYKSTASPPAGLPSKEPLRVLLDAIRRAELAPTIAERRMTVVRLLLEHGIRIHHQDPLFDLADAYGAHYRKIASETVKSVIERDRNGAPTSALWLVAFGSASVSLAVGLAIGPLLFMRQVEPTYAVVGLLSMLFGGLLVGALFWLMLRVQRNGGSDVD